MASSSSVSPVPQCIAGESPWRRGTIAPVGNRVGAGGSVCSRCRVPMTSGRLHSIRVAAWARSGLPFGRQDSDLSRSGMLGRSALEGRGSRRRGSRLRENNGGVVMRAGGGDKADKGSGDDQVETLFMRELRRRGLSSTESSSSGSAGTDTKTREDESQAGGLLGRGWPYSKTSSSPELTDSQKDEQQKRSMALSREGLDGLVPRASELLKLGGSLFLFAIWPFVVLILVAFLALYLYFGSTFIHRGNTFEETGRPPYADPNGLLEENIPSEIGPNRVPYNWKSGNGSP